MQYIGIDISKDYFDADLGSKGIQRFANMDEGYSKLIAALPPTAHCVMEATGPYGYMLATVLDEHRIAVSIVNPLQVKRYGQSKLRRIKDDATDAELLTQFGEVYAPPLWHPAPAYIAQLKQLRTFLESLTSINTMLKNQKHALSHMPVKDAILVQIQEEMSETLKNSIATIKQHMEDIARQECAALYKRIQTITGIGPEIAIALIAVTNAFTTFTSAKQLASYIGMCPQITQSGKSNPGKAHLCKIGDPGVRRLLYMGSCSAIRYNRACRELNDRMSAKGKPKKVILIAAGNKLLHRVIAIVQKQEDYHDDYQPIRKKNTAL